MFDLHNCRKHLDETTEQDGLSSSKFMSWTCRVCRRVFIGKKNPEMSDRNMEDVDEKEHS